MKIIKEKKVVNKDIKLPLLVEIISSFFYVGFIKKASGTFGSLFALIFLAIPGFYNTYVLFIFVMVSFILGIITSQIMMQKYGDDPSVVIIDEVSGLWIAFFLMSIFGIELNFINAIMTFFFFRVFDIIKILPAKYFDNIKNGYGIMMDDIIAGIYSGILVILIEKIIL